MHRQSRPSPSLLTDVLLTIGFAAVFSWFYRGFLHPDPYLLEKNILVQALYWSLVITLPLVGLGMVGLYYAIRHGKLTVELTVLACSSALGALLLAYPVAAWLYDRSHTRQLQEFHPYLQLMPQNITNPDQLIASPTRPFTVFCLGGSTTEHRDKTGKGWPDRVEAILQETVRGRDIRFVNLGREWYTTQHTLINYSLNLRQFRPDALIIMQSVNDLLVNADFSYMSRGTFRPDYGHFLGPESRIIQRYGLPDFLRSLFRGFWYHEPRETVVTQHFLGIESFRRNLERLIEMAQTDKTRLILMSEPYLFKTEMNKDELAALRMINYEAVGPGKQWSVETARIGMDMYNETMRRTAQRYGLTFIDLQKAVPKDLEHFKDEVHYQPKAYPLIAQFIARSFPQDIL